MIVEQIAGNIREQGWCVTPAAYDTRALRGAASTAWSAGKFLSAGVGRAQAHRVDDRIRGDQIHWLEANEAAPDIAACLLWFESLRSAINASCYLGLFDFEAHFARYAPGAHYARHLDRFETDTTRTVSCVLYLNEAWSAADGGQLRLHLGEDLILDIEPISGTLVTFLCDRFVHEVLPCSRERWSIAGWFRTRPKYTPFLFP